MYNLGKYPLERLTATVKYCLDVWRYIDLDDPQNKETIGIALAFGNAFLRIANLTDDEIKSLKKNGDFSVVSEFVASIYPAFSGLYLDRMYVEILQEEERFRQQFIVRGFNVDGEK